jgi:hypothetical protein
VRLATASRTLRSLTAPPWSPRGPDFASIEAAARSVLSDDVVERATHDGRAVDLQQLEPILD